MQRNKLLERPVTKWPARGGCESSETLGSSREEYFYGVCVGDALNVQRRVAFSRGYMGLLESLYDLSFFGHYKRENG